MEKQGAKAVHNGKCFEATTDLGFRLQNDYTDVLHQGEFYDYFGIVWSNFLSKKIVPDEVVVNHRTETIYIIEKKYKSVYGSDDEKLLACEAKLLSYKRMLASFGYKVEMIYLCNDWYKKPCYRDTFVYMGMKGIKHFFNEIPLSELGIVA